MTYHDLRHTFATVLMAEGADTRSLISLMGHSALSTTVGIYASATIEAMSASMRRAEDAYESGRTGVAGAPGNKDAIAAAVAEYLQSLPGPTNVSRPEDRQCAPLWPSRPTHQ